MPIVTSYRNGSTAGTPPTRNDHVRAKRGAVVGWSAGAVRRHTKWLYGVDADALADSGLRGYSVTLTMRDCPPDSDALHRALKSWVERVERLGVTRLHWVIEWQRRGVPHVHAALYVPEAVDAHQPGRSPEFGATAAALWVAVAGGYGASLLGQHYAPISGPLGWLQYLSKHAARGAKHYQRQGHPEGWEKTGRLWGYRGSWPTITPIRYQLSMPAFHRYRRLVRAWRVANARTSGNIARVVYARRMLACNERGLSSVRGVSDWLPEHVTLQLLAMLEREGYDVEQEQLDA